MKTVDNADFIRDFTAKGVAFTRVGNAPDRPTFEHPERIEVELSGELLERTKQFGWTLSPLLRGKRFGLWRHRGSWEWPLLEGETGFRVLQRGIRRLISELGFPAGGGSIWFDPDEFEMAFVVLHVCYTIARGTADDLFILPEAGDFVIWLDHDGMILVECRDMAVRSTVAAVLSPGSRTSAPGEAGPGLGESGPATGE